MKRFGIRSLLGLVALVAVFVGRDIFISTGDIRYSDDAVLVTGRLKQDIESNATFVSLSNNQEIVDKDLLHLRSMPNLESISANNTRLTDACISIIESLPNVTEVSVFGSDLSKEGQKRLSDLLSARSNARIGRILAE